MQPNSWEEHLSKKIEGRFSNGSHRPKPLNVQVQVKGNEEAGWEHERLKSLLLLFCLELKFLMMVLMNTLLLSKNP